MSRTIEIFEDFQELLSGDLEVFKYPVSELLARYGEGYRNHAVFILTKVEEFARRHGDTLGGALRVYGEHVRQASEDYKLFGQTGKYQYSSEDEIRHLVGDHAFRLHYMYALTLSTLLNRGRYELFLHYRRIVEKYLRPGGSALEIGGGNCLDAMFASGYGGVKVYETNELSLLWHEILGLRGQVELNIERYTFDGREEYDFVTMIELLEHVSDPAAYLRGAHSVLKADGSAYMTFAVRMPQVDHLYQFHTVEQCKTLVSESGFSIVEDYCTIANHVPFEEPQRWKLADDPGYAVTYCCVVEKRPAGDVDQLLQDFMDDL